MANSYFTFKQFVVNQENCAMKVGTDGVLLGSWANIGNANYVLDVGTGTGLIALMLAQRSNAQITAIEIDENASIQAIENVENSAFKKQIKVLNVSLQDFSENNNLKFDYIVSNPPYFQNSLKSENLSRTIARHTTELSFDELISNSVKLLSNFGHFIVIIPKIEEVKCIEIASKYGIYPCKILNVKPTPNKEINRIVIDFSKTEQETIFEEIIIEISGRHNYSKEYIQLTKEFYLKL